MPEEYKYTEYFSSRLAVLCSDERFAKTTIRFLEDSMGIAGCDFMILPGGPEFIANGNGELLERLQLLVEVHKMKEIILISHGDCGYYNKYFSGYSAEDISKKQIEDLRKAKKRLDILFPESSTRGFYGRLKSPGIIEFAEIS